MKDAGSKILNVALGIDALAKLSEVLDMIIRMAH